MASIRRYTSQVQMVTCSRSGLSLPMWYEFATPITKVTTTCVAVLIAGPQRSVFAF